jgi:hypothetical protein
MKAQILACVGLAALLASQVGCHVDPETLASLEHAVKRVSADQNRNPQSSNDPASVVTEVQFSPSYPDRHDPFSFPENAALEGPQAAPSLATVSQIEVLGFASVGRQHVLLRSGEISKSLQVGESINGVQVIAINPPTVQLQLGTLVWSATMFDKPNGE